MTIASEDRPQMVRALLGVTPKPSQSIAAGLFVSWVLAVFGAEGDAMTPHHVEVLAFGVYRMATEQAGHTANSIRNRLFQVGFTPQLSSTSGLMLCHLALRRPETPRQLVAISRMREIFRRLNLPWIGIGCLDETQTLRDNSIQRAQARRFAQQFARLL